MYIYNNTIVQQYVDIETILHKLHLINEAVSSPKVKRLFDTP